MKILPIYQNSAAVMYGAFMEGNLPNPLNYDMQTVLNNMVSGRVFMQTQQTAGQQALLPSTQPSYQVSPPPAWTTAQGYRGKRVLPKVTFPGHTDVFSEINTSIGSVQYQLDVIFATILWHRVCHTTNPNWVASAAPISTGTVFGAKNKNAEGSWTYVEYDFGADVVINSLASIAGTSAASNLLNPAASYLLFLQVQVGGVWQDVTSITNNLSNTGLEKFYQLPAEVRGRRFRIVSKAAANPFATGFGTYALHFYGDYVSGTAPRTVGKVQHLVMFQTAFGTSYAAPSMSTGLIVQSYGRYFGHYGLSITDDLKQAASNDLFISDATVYPGQEQAISSFTVSYKPITTEVY